MVWPPDENDKLATRVSPDVAVWFWIDKDAQNAGTTTNAENKNRLVQHILRDKGKFVALSNPYGKERQESRWKRPDTLSNRRNASRFHFSVLSETVATVTLFSAAPKRSRYAIRIVCVKSKVMFLRKKFEYLAMITAT